MIRATWSKNVVQDNQINYRDKNHLCFLYPGQREPMVMQIHDHFVHELISKYSDTGHMFSVKMCPQSHHHVLEFHVLDILLNS